MIHPRQIIKHLPDSIKERLSNNSSNEQVLNSTKPEYEKTLKDSGYKNENLKYRVLKEQRQKNDWNRKLIWFNPHYTKQVSTNIAKRFLNILDQPFLEQHALCKIFNRNAVKVSYSCTEKMSSFISSHNKNYWISVQKTSIYIYIYTFIYDTLPECSIGRAIY